MGIMYVIQQLNHIGMLAVGLLAYNSLPIFSILGLVILMKLH